MATRKLYGKNTNNKPKMFLWTNYKFLFKQLSIQDAESRLHIGLGQSSNH